MIGNLPIARDVVEAGGRIGKRRGHQIGRHHALQLRRHFLPAAVARNGQRNRGVPAPARLEHRRVEKRLHEHVARGRGMQIAEDVAQRKRVLRSEREQQRFVGRRRLQLEVELPAEALAQRQAPRLVDAAAEGRVQHQLHAARLVEEALEHERVLRRHGAERPAALGRDTRRPARRRPGRCPLPPRASQTPSVANAGTTQSSQSRIAGTLRVLRVSALIVVSVVGSAFRRTSLAGPRRRRGDR